MICIQQRRAFPLVSGNSSRNAYGNRRVPLIPVPSHSGRVPPGGDRSTPFVSKSRFFPRQKSKFGFPPKGQRNVGRCGEEHVAGEHGCAGGTGGGGQGNQLRHLTITAWLLLQICNCCLRQQAPLLQPFLLLMSQANPSPQSHNVPMYSWHTIYAWHTCTCIHTHIHTYIHLYIYIHLV